MPTITEFLIYQTLAGNLGAIYYCQTTGDLTGKYVPLDEYESTANALSRQLQEANELGIAQEKRIFELQTELAKYEQLKAAEQQLKRDLALCDNTVEKLQGNIVALTQVIENYRQIEAGLIELNHKGDTLIAQAASEVEGLKRENAVIRRQNEVLKMMWQTTSEQTNSMLNEINTALGPGRE